MLFFHQTILADGQDLFTVLNHSKCQTILTSRNRPEFKHLQKFLKMGNSVPSAEYVLRYSLQLTIDTNIPLVRLLDTGYKLFQIKMF